MTPIAAVVARAVLCRPHWAAAPVKQVAAIESKVTQPNHMFSDGHLDVSVEPARLLARGWARESR